MKTLLSALAVVLAISLAAHAQDAAPNPAKVLAPYVDETTYLVGMVDLQNVDLDGLLDRLAKVGMPKDQVAKMKGVAVQTRDDLVRAGGRHICFILNLDERFEFEPLLVIPVGPGGKAQGVAEAIERFGLKVKIKGETVLAGKPRTVEAALDHKPVAVPEFAKALAAVEALPTRVAFTIPTAFRKSLEELAPKLPKEIGGGPITPISRGFTWGAAGVDLSADKLQLRAIVQTKDAETATELSRLVDRALLRPLAAKENSPEVVKGLEAIRPEVKGDQIRLALNAKALDAAVLPLIAKVREAAARAQATNDLKQIALAMHNYHDVYKSFPAQASYDKNKKPLLSWRVHLLPFVEGAELYKQFKLDEPWDSANNKPLIAKMPAVFRSPHIVNAEPGKTTYLVPVGKGLIFDGPKKTKISQITDGTSNTIFVVEADESRAVWWTQPEDYKVDRKNPKAGLLRPGAPWFLAALADGSVRVFAGAIRDETLWLYFDPNDGQAIPD
jgi:hypothetical protein